MRTRRSIVGLALIMIVLSFIASPAIADDREKAAGLILRGDEKARSGELREAMEFFLSARSLDPNSYDVHRRIAQIALELKERQLALETIERMKGIKPDLLANEKFQKFVAQIEALPFADTSAPKHPTNVPVTGEMSLDQKLELTNLKAAYYGEYPTALKSDPVKAQSLLAESRKHVMALLAVPDPTNIEIWVLAAGIAMDSQDDVLGAYAVDALNRLAPEQIQGDSLNATIVQLSRREKVRELVKKIPAWRASFLQNHAEADRNEVYAMGAVAQAYRRGEGVLPSEEIASRRDKKLIASRKNDDVRSAWATSIAAKDQLAALFWARIGAEMGQPELMEEWGVQLLSGSTTQGIEQTQPDRELAMRWLTKAAEADYGPAFVSLARICESAGQSEKAMNHWRKAGELGVPDACWKLAKFAEAANDNVAVVKWLQQGAVARDPECLYQLGRAYADGQFGLAKERDRGAALMLMAKPWPDAQQWLQQNGYGDVRK